MTGCNHFETLYKHNPKIEDHQYVSVEVDYDNQLINFLCYQINPVEECDVVNCQYRIDDIKQFLDAYKQKIDFSTKDNHLQMVWQKEYIRDKMIELCDITSCNVDCDCIGNVLFSKNYRESIVDKLVEAVNKLETFKKDRQ